MSDYISKITINNNTDARDIAAKYAVKEDNSGVFNIDTTYAKLNNSAQNISANQITATIINATNNIITAHVNAQTVKVQNKKVATEEWVGLNYAKLDEDAQEITTGDLTVQNGLFIYGDVNCKYSAIDNENGAINTDELNAKSIKINSKEVATEEWVNSKIETQLAGVEALLKQLNGKTGGSN